MSKQLIALQGNHQDKIDFTQEQSRNEGNFIAILRLLAKNNRVCKFYWGCLRKCPHYSLIADEVTSHDKEILFVCLRFLEIDHANFQIKPKKHEVLLEFYFLQRITGKSIADNIYKHYKHIKSMSEIAKDRHMIQQPGVQAHIK